MGYWWVKLTGLCNVGTAFAGTIVDGAVDCIVVKVVAKDSWDCCGELKVLFARPLYMPSVWVVPALEKPVSECMVSAFVASVGALDLLLRMGAFGLPVESSYEVKLPTRSEPTEAGVKEDAPPLKVLGAGGFETYPDSRYGLFFPLQFRFVRGLFFSPCGLEPECFRFASRFIQVEKGRRPLLRSNSKQSVKAILRIR